MSDTVVQCVTEPCVSKCPDSKMMIYPPPIVITMPGLSLTTNPGKCLVETKTSCLTNGSELCGDGCSTAIATKSSGLRAISGGDTPCCTATCSDSQLVIYPPPVCITVPGAMLISHPNECLIETSTPCESSGSHPHAIQHSTSVSDCSLTPHGMYRSTSVPCGLNSDAQCVVHGESSKVVIHPPEIEITLPSPIVEVLAEECVVEIYNQCEGPEAIASAERCAITSGEENSGEVKVLAARAKDCATVRGLLGPSSYISEGPEMKLVVKPPPVEIDIPAPILKVFPETCKVEVLEPCTQDPLALESNKLHALCSKETTTSTALATRGSSLHPMKRPLPDIRRPSRPWAEIYGKSITPRSVMNEPPRFSKYHNGFSCMSHRSSY